MHRVLVLGSGQLGLMLAEAGARWGMSVDRLDIDNERIYYGSGRTALPLDDFDPFNHYDLVTVEREFMPDTDLVQALREHPGWKGEKTLVSVANRRREKELLDKLGIATATWLPVTGPVDQVQLARQLGETVVIKAVSGGYDGRSQWRLQNGKLPDGTLEKPGFEAIAERLVAFERELSIVGARNARDQCVFYPLAQNEHVDGMLRHSIAPAPDSAGLQQAAQDILAAIMRELGYEGVMAAELFVEDGRLLVNEIAPRVHNSGHWTQRGARPNQFQLHLLALMNRTLPVPLVDGLNAMVNIIGVELEPSWLVRPDLDTHWYGKEVRPGRKLGHVNLAAADYEALQLAVSTCKGLLYG